MTEDSNKHFLITVAADSGGFLRWQCPGCGQDFKLKGEVSEQQDALAWWLQQSLRDAEVASSDQDPPSSDSKSTCCPYCAKLGPRQDFVHPETVSYIRRIARREIIEPALFKMFRDFGSGLHSNSFIKVTVSGPSVRSPRPISGPEPDDLVPILCLQCGGTFKVDNGWRGTVHCPTCHTELLPQ